MHRVCQAVHISIRNLNYIFYSLKITGHSPVVWFVRQPNDNHHQTKRKPKHQLSIVYWCPYPPIQLLLPNVITSPKFIIIFSLFLLLFHVTTTLKISVSPVVRFINPSLYRLFTPNSLEHHLERSFHHQKDPFELCFDLAKQECHQMTCPTPV